VGISMHPYNSVKITFENRKLIEITEKARGDKAQHPYLLMRACATFIM